MSKLLIRPVYAVLLLSYLLTGCVKDGGSTVVPSDSRRVTMSINVPGKASTRAPGDFEESKIEEIDILVFDEVGLFLYHTKATTIQSDYKFEAVIRKSTAGKKQQFVVLANLSSEIGSLTLEEGTKKQIITENLKFHFYKGGDTRRDWPTGQDVTDTRPARSIPMWGETKEFYYVTDALEGSDIEEINMVRSLAAVSISLGEDKELKLPVSDYFRIDSIAVYNIPSQGQAIPDPAYFNRDSLRVLAPSVCDTDYGKAYYRAQGNYAGGIYIGEKDNSSGDEAAVTFIAVRGYYTDDVNETPDPSLLNKPLWYRLDIRNRGDVGYHDILRNHSYRIVIDKVRKYGADTDDMLLDTSLDATLIVDDWTEENIDIIKDRTLTLSQIEATVTERNMARIWITSSQPELTIEEMTVGGDKVEDLFYGLDDGAITNLHYTYDPLTRRGYGYLDLVTDRKKISSYYAEHKLVISSGGLRREIKVKVDIDPADDPWDVLKEYVGAFWKNDQKGERLISHKNEGPWEAKVVQGEDWIRLATGKTLDTKIWTDDPGDAENYVVEGDDTSVSGDGDVHLRIGLTGTNPGNTPRYGLVQIYMFNKSPQDIYIRQGEAADYVMSYNEEERPLATKISAYNVTAEDYISGRLQGGVSMDDHAKLSSIIGGTWTEYPSQAGAYFQWGTTPPSSLVYGEGYAYHPSNADSLKDWNTIPFDYFWAEGNVALLNDYCPAGYRRPHNGDTDKPVLLPNTDSEIKMTLFMKDDYQTEQPGNNNDGYYADGFFDRRRIVNKTTVSPSDHRVAYWGHLFYNPDTCASVFLPGGGQRNREDGGFLARGEEGFYLTTARMGKFTTWSLGFGNSGSAYITSTYSSLSGMSLRCVVDE